MRSAGPGDARTARVDGPKTHARFHSSFSIPYSVFAIHSFPAYFTSTSVTGTIVTFSALMGSGNVLISRSSRTTASGFGVGYA